VAETPADLIEKLIILHVKLYHVQEKVMEAGEVGNDLDADTVAKLHRLNLQRGPLKSEINQSAGYKDDPEVKVLPD
jgi:hypothetical protein